MIWKYFKWGAKNHPGNGFYVMVVGGVWLAAFLNENILSGVIGATVATILFAILYISTSISVGKANKRFIKNRG